jgi:uncharacterized protein YoaH (UPF0181 family)
MAIDRYDPLKAPDPTQWLALDEGARMELVTDYHASAGVALPNARVHAAMHVGVEKVRQLMVQGVNRHDAIHAVASVLVNHLYDMAKGKAPAGDPNERYYAALKRLNARKWLRSG